MIDLDFLGGLVKLLAGTDAVIAVLVITILGLLAAIRWIWAKYDALRVEASEDIKQLQTQLGELNGDYSQSNNRAADTLDKIGQTLLKLAELTGKR